MQGRPVNDVRKGNEERVRRRGVSRRDQAYTPENHALRADRHGDLDEILVCVWGKCECQRKSRTPHSKPVQI